MAVLYQIWWDTIMELELFVIAPKQGETTDVENAFSTRISSLHLEILFLHIALAPDEYMLLHANLELETNHAIFGKHWLALCSIIPNTRRSNLRQVSCCGDYRFRYSRENEKFYGSSRADALKV